MVCGSCNVIFNLYKYIIDCVAAWTKLQFLFSNNENNVVPYQICFLQPCKRFNYPKNLHCSLNLSFNTISFNVLPTFMPRKYASFISIKNTRTAIFFSPFSFLSFLLWHKRELGMIFTSTNPT